MAFESLTEKLQNVFKALRGKGRLSEEDVKTALKEVKMALLEAINSGTPINAEAFAALPGLEDIVLSDYVIRPVDGGEGSASEDLKDMLTDMDMDDESDVAQNTGTQLTEEYRTLYNEYMAKRHETGNMAEMTYEQFVGRMMKNVEKISVAHPGMEINFVVALQNGKAVLTPQITPKS